jgi:hypothetical protein
VAREAFRKQRRPSIPTIKQRGSIMLATFLNAIYREVLRVSISGMTSWGRRL